MHVSPAWLSMLVLNMPRATSTVHRESPTPEIHSGDLNQVSANPKGGRKAKCLSELGYQPSNTGSKLTRQLQKRVPRSMSVQQGLAALPGKANQKQRVPSLMGHGPMAPNTGGRGGCCSQVHQQQQTRSRGPIGS